MNTNNFLDETCKEIKNYIDGTLRADLYLAVRWEQFVGYYLSEYDEAIVKACLPHLGVVVQDGIVFLWAGEEYYRRLVEAVAELARREGASVVADPYREET